MIDNREVTIKKLNDGVIKRTQHIYDYFRFNYCQENYYNIEKEIQSIFSKSDKHV